MCHNSKGHISPTYTFCTQNNDQDIKDFGIQLATEMVKRLVSEGDVQGVHFCTLNLERSVRKILENLQWVRGTPKTNNKLIAVCATFPSTFPALKLA